MTRLQLARQIDRPDDVYDRLIGLHEGLTDTESMIANARLILVLMNHIGDEEVLFEAFQIARGNPLNELS